MDINNENIIDLKNYLFLKNLINSGRFNDGEDFLFESVINKPSIRGKKIAFWFYKKLMNKSDIELIKGNFTRDEIKEGLGDIKRIFSLN